MRAILINVIIVIFIFGLTTYMNIKTTFAKNEKEAMRHAKTLILNLALILACGWGAYRLFIHFSSPGPLDKETLLFILINAFTLFYVVIIFHIQRIIKLIESIIQIVEHK